jgi:hypothetical protein
MPDNANPVARVAGSESRQRDRNLASFKTALAKNKKAKAFFTDLAPG